MCSAALEPHQCSSETHERCLALRWRWPHELCSSRATWMLVRDSWEVFGIRMTVAIEVQLWYDNIYAELPAMKMDCLSSLMSRLLSMYLCWDWEMVEFPLAPEAKKKSGLDYKTWGMWMQCLWVAAEYICFLFFWFNNDYRWRMRYNEEEMKEVCMWNDVEESRPRIRDSTP